MSNYIEKVIDAAQAHGEQSEPDHEVGDLQDALRALWSLLTPKQRAAFEKDETFSDRIADWSRPTCEVCGEHTDDDGECGDCVNCHMPLCIHHENAGGAGVDCPLLPGADVRRDQEDLLLRRRCRAQDAREVRVEARARGCRSPSARTSVQVVESKTFDVNTEIICAKCGSPNVSYAIWHHPNHPLLDRDGECFGTWNYGDNSYCDDCGHDRLLDYGSEPKTFDALRRKYARNNKEG